MKKYIERLSSTSEFIIITGLSFGYSILLSFLWLQKLVFSKKEITFDFTNQTIVFLVVGELFVLLAIYGILIIRGWNWKNFGFQISSSLTMAGILLFYIIWISDSFFYSFWSGLFRSTDLFNHVRVTSHVTFLFNFIGSIVNPFFEETIVVGYVVQSLERKNDPFFVISVSAITRMGYHLYQGPIAVVSILPLGMLFAFTYWKWRTLWPLILAHGLMDFVALALK